MDGREKLPGKLPGCVVPPQGGKPVPTTLLIQLLEEALHPVDLRDALRDFRDIEPLLEHHQRPGSSAHLCSSGPDPALAL